MPVNLAVRHQDICIIDIYHLQKTEGNIIKNIDLTWDEIAYFQIGDNPGRKEPGTGELNYNNIFKHHHKSNEVKISTQAWWEWVASHMLCSNPEKIQIYWCRETSDNPR